MNIEWILSIVIGITAFVLIDVIFELHVFRDIVGRIYDIIDFLSEQLGQYNTKRYISRIKRERIVIQKENLITKYNRFVEMLILDFNMPLTLENFTSLLVMLCIVVMFIFMFFSKSITVSIALTISLVIAALTLFVMQAKSIHAQHLEWVMEAEDLICPLASEGVLNAIKKVLESSEHLNRNVRPYFSQFVDNCENNGYSFRQAMELLNRQLGPKFNNFAKKAIIFEYNERPGMADVFKDIVDENAVLREMNARKDRLFRKMNRDFLIKTTMIILFFIYALSVDEFKDFILNTNMGKIINTFLVSTICLSFARAQSLQGSFISGGDVK